MSRDSRTGIVHSEFAQVRIGIDYEGLSPRLRLEDLKTGRVRFLDALELETIVWLRDPSSDRWRETPMPDVPR